MNNKEIIRRIEAVGMRVTSDILKDLINEHSADRSRMIKDYNNYQGDEIPISERRIDNPLKKNNRIANDYRGEIIDQAVGYLFGKPITYSVDKESYSSDTDFETAHTTLEEFLLNNHIEDLDIESGKLQATCGYAARIMYIDTEGVLRCMNVNPWEMIFIKDRSLDKMQYAMRYYYVDVVEGDNKYKQTRVEWYDERNVTFYISRQGGDFILDPSEPRNPIPHQFDRVPCIEILNNAEKISDTKKVKTLIDAYDKTISDAQNEIEEFRLAYLMLKEINITPEMLQEIRASGAFNNVPAEGSIEYITKQINDVFLENHKNTLKDNIYRFSKTIDINSDTFTGQGASGEARKWVLTALEWRCGIKEVKFNAALNKMFQVATDYWQKRSIPLSWRNISFNFDRNIPQELMLEADIQMKLKGLVSERTRLSMLSAVRDVDSEIKAMEDEREGMISLDNIPEETETEE